MIGLLLTRGAASVPMEDMMLTRLSLLTLAMISVAGMAHARTPPAQGPRKVAITDEYSFRYDAWGNRLNGADHVVAPPRTLPGATVIQNGPGQS